MPWLSIVAVLALLPACDAGEGDGTAESDEGLTRLDGPAARDLVGDDPSIVVLDVRTAEEFDVGHITGAQNIDIQDPRFDELAGALDRGAGTLVHCAAGAPGGRSNQAAERLRSLGFQRVYHLEGGYAAWQAAGER